MKKRLILFTIIILTLPFQYTSDSSAQITEPGITIEEIIPNRYIAGKVFGITHSQYDNYKVIVYVHTDKWYIHPYAIGGDGKSYAKISNGGNWQIVTVKRDFPADNVAVLIVEKTYKPPAFIEDIYRIKHVAITIKDTGYKEGDENLFARLMLTEDEKEEESLKGKTKEDLELEIREKKAEIRVARLIGTLAELKYRGIKPQLQ